MLQICKVVLQKKKNDKYISQAIAALKTNHTVNNDHRPVSVYSGTYQGG